MQYYKNSELARLYHVSQSAVGKWVEAARKGRLDLELIEHGTKSYIAATTKNRTVIDAMVQERKKYFNSRSIKSVTPKPEFYTLFNPEQVLDIIKNLENHGEIPRQYNYFNGGAHYWDQHVSRLLESGTPSAVIAAIYLFKTNFNYIADLLSDYKRINVIDIGPGNALPIKNFLQTLIAQKMLGRYLALDISPDILEITRRNILAWFDDKVLFDADIRDITRDRFDDLLVSLSLAGADTNSTNLVLFLDSMLGNLAYPDEALRNIYHSMGRKDLLVYTLRLDSSRNRQVFDFASKTSALSPNHRLVFDLLNIDSSFYDVEMGYNETLRERFVKVRLKFALEISFELPEGIRTVEFDRDEIILLWRYRHQTAKEIIDQFERNGFNVIQASQTKDHEFLMLVCDIKTDR